MRFPVDRQSAGLTTNSSPMPRGELLLMSCWTPHGVAGDSHAHLHLVSTVQGLLRWLRPRPSGETAGMRTRRPHPKPVPRSAFSGFCFPPDVIVLAVRWYLRFGLSYRDVEELLVERGVEVDHVTIYRCCCASRHCWPTPPALPPRCRRPLAGRRDLRQGGRAVALRLPRDRPVRPDHRRVRLRKTRR
jgi:hypothetical protein